METQDTGLAIQQAAHEGQTFAEQATQVSAVVIDSAEKESQVIEFLAEVKSRYNKLDETRKFFTAPLNQQVDAINAKFMPLLKNLKAVETTLKSNVSAWRTSEDVKRAEMERKMIESQAKTAVQEGDIGKLQELQPRHEELSAQAPKRVETSNGTATFREMYRWNVTDIAQVPSEFTKVVVDDEKLDAYVKATKGMAKVAGVTITIEKIPIIRR